MSQLCEDSRVYCVFCMYIFRIWACWPGLDRHGVGIHSNVWGSATGLNGGDKYKFSLDGWMDVEFEEHSESSVLETDSEGLA